MNLTASPTDCDRKQCLCPGPQKGAGGPGQKAQSAHPCPNRKQNTLPAKVRDSDIMQMCSITVARA